MNCFCNIYDAIFLKYYVLKKWHVLARSFDYLFSKLINSQIGTLSVLAEIMNSEPNSRSSD